MPGEPRRRERHMGRSEAALEASLRDRPDIVKATRTALRVQAHALDLAEQAYDPELITTVNAGYLDLLKANGLTSDGAAPVDEFDQLLAALGRPTASPSHPEAP
jgi:hypothetical protein